jgi:hypothetical protein
MKKKLQVFVSSTYTDLLAERQAVVEAILRAGHIPAGMELFAAGNESQLETIRRWIDDSDVFMLILGGRYGSIEPTSSKSYTELEYEYAIEKEKQFFAAIIKESYLEEKVKADGPDAVEKLNGLLLKTFREKVTSKTSQFFGDLNELKVIVFQCLADNERYKELPGWIRGSDAIDPKAILEEVERLQSENELLRKQVEKFESLQIALASSRQKKLVASLSHDAKALLSILKDGSSISLVMDTVHIHDEDPDKPGKVRGFKFKDHRDQVHWKHVLSELYELGLVDNSGMGRFRCTHLGYEVADEIEENANPSYGQLEFFS